MGDLISRASLLAKMERVITHGVAAKDGKHHVSIEAIIDLVKDEPDAVPDNKEETHE